MTTTQPTTRQLSHLQRLESESIQIIREAVAESERPVMLYSIGKDSGTMLHLARKAFYPSPPPFPLLHVDTTWKFQAMYEFRDKMAAEAGMRNPMTSSSLRRAVVPSSSVISASQSRLVSAPLGWSRWSATNADQ